MRIDVTLKFGRYVLEAFIEAVVVQLEIVHTELDTKIDKRNKVLL